MSENTMNQETRVRRIRHRGRTSQISIYLGKQLRFFINQNDWKVLPMAAVIAALVSMVIRRRFFINMEGSLIGAFALTCVAIWNGCFNSIQAVCRERPIIKREHRSGMHISAYVAAHMIYQLALCAAQTGISLYVMTLVGVPIPKEGFMTPYMIVDIGITMLLISYAADMMSLLISSIAHTTTGAMTVMPFVLIFQLVFSGGVIPLPAWSRPMSNFTISNYGIKALAAQSGYNELPMVTAWNTLEKMKGREIGGTVSVGDILDFLNQPENEALNSRRDMVILPAMTAGEAKGLAKSAVDALGLRDQAIYEPVKVRTLLEGMMTSEVEAVKKLRDFTIVPAIGGSGGVTVGDLANALLTDEGTQEVMEQEIGTTVTLGQAMDALAASDAKKLLDGMADTQLNGEVTLGQVIDFLVSNETLQANRDKSLTLKTTIGDVMNLIGEDKVRDMIQRATASASYNADYARTQENVENNWWMLGLFILVFALASVIALEMIDQDKR